MSSVHRSNEGIPTRENGPKSSHLYQASLNQGLAKLSNNMKICEKIGNDFGFRKFATAAGGVCAFEEATRRRSQEYYDHLSRQNWYSRHVDSLTPLNEGEWRKSRAVAMSEIQNEGKIGPIVKECSNALSNNNNKTNASIWSIVPNIWNYVTGQSGVEAYSVKNAQDAFDDYIVCMTPEEREEWYQNGERTGSSRIGHWSQYRSDTAETSDN